MRLLAIAIFSLFLAAPAPALAHGQNVGASVACENAQNTAAMRACENARLRRATEAMDAAYQALSARLDARGQAKLRAAQQAWLKFRAAEADYQADVARDGTLAPLIGASVQADLTEARGKDLDKAARELK
ncbi:MAG: DUF1311 domain-containing protein [Burkholderiales bacterium]|nr:DUF1311 domain-containing protein [Burkholderiales bacterium]